MNEAERRRAIQEQLARLGAAFRGRSVKALSTGFASPDAALGIGGFPCGAITEVFGPASCGKTALVLQAIAHAQHSGATAAWIDAEHSFDAGFASHMGIDVARLPVTAPESAEGALEMARRLASSGAVDLIAIDSAAALVPRLELESGVAVAGLQSRVLSSELRRLTQSAMRSGTAIVLLNQIRTRAATSGEPETSAGGVSVKLHAAVRIGLSARGRRVRVRVVKNNLGAAFREAHLDWQHDGGFAEACQDG
jgi:recombination protein RecA